MKATYISLFSGAGVGCFGFQQLGFECVATNELLDKRLNIQRINNKCKYDHGYILGDVSLRNVQDRLLDEIKFWKKNEDIKDIDVLIATPPCQGMSLANHKKNSKDIIRNSLVVESIKLVKTIKPKFFIFENVPSFCKTICTDVDGSNKEIGVALEDNLSKTYMFRTEVINFKNYGCNSSRKRTLVIGVRNDLTNYCTPLDLFPSFRQEKNLYDVIGHLPRLNYMGEISDNDIYHFFRKYDVRMRDWIHDLKENESAFDNLDISKRPHQIIDGVIKINIKKNGDKYKRQSWNKVGPCIHTRNDQLASQNTIHPTDDRVFSIRELMELMSIPNTFKWSDKSEEYLNSLPLDSKKTFLKNNEINIRQSIGEAVPTEVFKLIAQKVFDFLSKTYMADKQIMSCISTFKLKEEASLISFLKENITRINYSSLEKIVELCNSQRLTKSAYFTDKKLIELIYDKLPTIEKDTIRILEPSVGAGNFLPYILKKYENKKIIFDVIDIDKHVLECLKILVEAYISNYDVSINFIHADFLKLNNLGKYDLIVGNPPFTKIKNKYLQEISNVQFKLNVNSRNMSSFFLEKSCQLSEHVCMIMPKNLLNTPEYKQTREYLKSLQINDIIDFGENGFVDVLVETIFLSISTNKSPTFVNISSISKKMNLVQKQKYICDNKFPYWIIYRNEWFDRFKENLKLNIFKVFRDRQITNKNTKHSKIENNDIFVLRSRNISEDGKNIIYIDGYDLYISEAQAKKLSIYKYFNNENVFLTPNMTYKTRVIRKGAGYVTNGSVAVLVPVDNNLFISDNDLEFFSSEEYRNFLQIARNYQTRTLNIDCDSVYFFGILRSNHGTEMD